jgi:protein-L-isoaspartate(D-aspartate) O-methyltransferase
MIAETSKIRLLMELRSQGITDARVLAAIERTPRNLFVPADLRDQAYENTALPIGKGQTISQPIVVATMTQKLDVGERMRVLEIGTGSGYQAAILARLARRVYTVERHRRLARRTRELFQELRLHNITVVHGDGSLGLPEQAPFDRIIVTAAAEDPPQVLIDQLRPGGIMVLPVGQSNAVQTLIRIDKTPAGLEYTDLGAVRFVPLVEGVAQDVLD